MTSDARVHAYSVAIGLYIVLLICAAVVSRYVKNYCRYSLLLILIIIFSYVVSGVMHFEHDSPGGDIAWHLFGQI